MEASRDPMSLSDADAFSVFFHDEDDADRWSGTGSSIDDFVEENDVENQTTNDAESKLFYESQLRQLEDELRRTSSIERRIRSDVEEALSGIRSSTAAACRCSDPPAREHCRRCMMRDLADRLRDAGYNSAICSCKWRKTAEIPSGEHRFVDVVVEGKGGKGAVRVLIELEFRAEFEMARASGEYNGMVSRLPEVFVGKAEKMKAVVKIMCAAAKRCMKENRMHIAPWRKCRYMQSKWLGPCGRSVAVAPAAAAPPPEVARVWQRKPRASMLTLDLHRTAVEVL